MAFSKSEFLPLSGMANSNAPRHFTYTTTDAKAAVVASGYFDSAALTMGLKLGDLIWSVSSNGGTATLEVVRIDAISASNVVTTKSSTLTLA